MVEPTKIQTCADLRKFLAEALVDLRYGHLDLKVARGMSEMSAQMNSSLKAEIQGWKLRADQGYTEDQRFGSFPLTLE